MDSEAPDVSNPTSRLEQVAAALSPLRASSNRSALANAVARLVRTVAVACRIDLFTAPEPDAAPQLVTLSRTVPPDRADLAESSEDLGGDEADAGSAAVIPDPRRGVCWVVIPLVANRARSGALRVVLEGPIAPPPSDLAFWHHIATSLALGLSSADLHEQSERVSRRLQETLLPAMLPAARWFDVAARYVPATAGLHVGGDWYDAQLMTPEELAISVGDVAGHGVEAAARMGELRTAIQAFRLLSRAPDDVITALHRLCDPRGYFSTALCARLDSEGGLRWASAGHLPLVVVDRHGNAQCLSGSQSPPLGVGVADQVALNSCRLSRGDTVLLFTDGLVERRDEPLDTSLHHLVAWLSDLCHGAPELRPDQLLDSLLESRLAARPTGDDIAIIAVRLLTDEPRPS